MVTLIDLGVGNIRSLSSALSFLGIRHRITESVEEVTAASALLLPGVGAYDAAIGRLDELSLREAILESVTSGVPTLGICLGMQLLLAGSEEGDAAGLGLISGQAVRLGRDPGSPVPHVGFDAVRADRDSWLWSAVGGQSEFYFTHSFALVDPPADASIGWCDYDGGFAAAFERWPVVGVQFHPEKSQSSGLRFIAEFVRRTRGLR